MSVRNVFHPKNSVTFYEYVRLLREAFRRHAGARRDVNRDQVPSRKAFDALPTETRRTRVVETRPHPLDHRGDVRRRRVHFVFRFQLELVLRLAKARHPRHGHAFHVRGRVRAPLRPRIFENRPRDGAALKLLLRRLDISRRTGVQPGRNVPRSVAPVARLSRPHGLRDRLGVVSGAPVGLADGMDVFVRGRNVLPRERSRHALDFVSRLSIPYGHFRLACRQIPLVLQSVLPTRFFRTSFVIFSFHFRRAHR